MTRSLAKMATGDLVESWHCHPLGFVLVAQITLLAVVKGSSRLRLSSRFTSIIIMANAAVFVGVWLARLLTGSLTSLQ